MQVRLLPWVIAQDDLIVRSYARYLFDPIFHEDSDFDLHFGSFYHPEAVPRPFLARVLSLYFFSLLEEEPPFSLLLLLLLLTEAAAAFALVASTSPSRPRPGVRLGKRVKNSRNDSVPRAARLVSVPLGFPGL